MTLGTYKLSLNRSHQIQLLSLVLLCHALKYLQRQFTCIHLLYSRKLGLEWVTPKVEPARACQPWLHLRTLGIVAHNNINAQSTHNSVRTPDPLKWTTYQHFRLLIMQLWALGTSTARVTLLCLGLTQLKKEKYQYTCIIVFGFPIKETFLGVHARAGIFVAT